MTKILGLDLGTNSIGWSVVETEDNLNFKLNEKGVRIFQEGVKLEKGNEVSRAAERTKYRSARRLKYRRRLRKINTIKVLIKYNFCPNLNKNELYLWRYKKKYPKNIRFREWLFTNEDESRNPYCYRSIAAERQLNIQKEEDRFKLGRAYYHLSQRRGFLSNRLEKTKESEGVIKKQINEISEKKSNRTLGQYFFELYQKGEKIRTLYTSRNEHYLEEFERICDMQKLEVKIKNELHKAIFYQRPLKSQKGLVGKCPFEKNKSRCSVSHPLFEEYRMLSFINNIRIKTPDEGKLRHLSKDEVNTILPLFFRKSKEHFKFEEICKKISQKNIYKYFRDRNLSDEDYLFNYKPDTSVSGCKTIANLIDIFGENWTSRIYELYTLKKCKKGIKTVDEVINDIWHVLYTYDKIEKIYEFGKIRLNLDDNLAEKFSKINIKQEYSNLSIKAIRKILPFLRKGYIYSHSVFLANLDSILPDNIFSDSGKRNLIINEIIELIANHTFESEISEIVNGLIKSAMDNSITWSDNDFALRSYQNDIKKKLESYYGEKTFNAFREEKKQEIVEKTTQLFQLQMQRNMGKGEFLEIRRIDERIKAFLKDQFGSLENLDKLYHPSAIDTFKPVQRANDGKCYLESPRVSSIRNPMAMRALHQLRYLVNELIRNEIIDKNTKINIEMARELNDANQRKAYRSWQNDREALRKKYYQEIKEIFKTETGKDIEPTKEDILKYQLWEEQYHVCLYTGEQIGLTEFIGANSKYDIEHTIPRSLSYDNSQENLTLCNNRFNRENKKNRMPSELPNHSEIIVRLEKWIEKYQELEKNIERSRIGSRSSINKEQRDFFIQKRHKLTFEKKYWEGKCDRFFMQDVPEGFKNSQLIDTGIITRYSRMFLKTVFDRIYSVKGSVVADFRRIWGLQGEYESKERINHIHHCIDAVVIACLTRENYDCLANYYHEVKQWEIGKNSLKPKNIPKPWITFTEDIKNLENEVLVSHFTPDRVDVQRKNKLRKRGKIIKSNSGKIIYQQGDTVRGPLHKETFYGAISRGTTINEEETENKILYVERKQLSTLAQSDIKNIVDDVVRAKVEEAIREKGIKQAIAEPIWMNEEKKIPIKKVRCYVPTVTTPIHLKAHRDPSLHEYKKFYHVANDRNYLMAIYEEPEKKSKPKRDFDIINYLEAGKYFKLSNRDNSASNSLVPIYHKTTGWPLKQIIKIGDLAILWEKYPEEIYNLEIEKIVRRLYKIVGLSLQVIRNKYRYGTIILKHHQDARPTSELKVQDGSFNESEDFKSFRKLNHNQFNGLIEGYDFRFTITGELTWLK